MAAVQDRKASFTVKLPEELQKNYEDKNKVLGSGGFARVILAEHVPTKEKVAIKVMNKKELSLKDDLHRAYNEIYALKNLMHQNICQLYEVFETDEFIYLVLEYCPGGELFDYIVSKKRLEEKEARHVFRQVVAAVAYIHKNGYAHRDLKPENMLLDSKKNIKIIDFGLSARPEKGLTTPLKTRAGSALYASPELISGEPYYGNETDVWSLGVVLYALLCGFLPFDHETTSELYRKIRRGDFPKPHWLSQASLKLLYNMLQVQPSKRINIKNILKHEWMNIGFNSKDIQWHSKIQRSKLDANVVKILSEYYCWSVEETQKKIFKFKYNHLTAFYFILSNMAEPKQKSFLNSFTVPHLDIDHTLMNKLLLHSNNEGSRLNGYIPEETPNSRPRSRSILHIPNTTNRNYNENVFSNQKYSNTFISNPRVPQQRASSLADIYSKDNLYSSSYPNKTSNNFMSAVRERSSTMDYSYSNKENRRHSNASRQSSRNTMPISEEDEDRDNNNPSNLIASKRLTASCFDNLDSSNEYKSSNEKDEQSTSIEKERKSRSRSVKEIKRRLSGFFKQMDTPRRVKAIYHVENTTTLPPEKVRTELERVLNLLVSADVLSSFTAPESFLFKCKAGVDKKTVFELEICLIPFMENVVGIRRKRLKGDAWKYKELIEHILSIAKI